MNSRKIKCIIIFLVILTGITALFHLRTREEITKAHVVIKYEDTKITLAMNELEYEEVKGIRINGKGEEIPINAPGISLQKLLNDASIIDYSKLTVISTDSYSAELSFQEIQNENKAFLLHEEEDELRLVVFGDKNSKRSVSHVAQIIVE